MDSTCSQRDLITAFGGRSLATALLSQYRKSSTSWIWLDLSCSFVRRLYLKGNGLATRNVSARSQPHWSWSTNGPKYSCFISILEYGAQHPRIIPQTPRANSPNSPFPQYITALDLQGTPHHHRQKQVPTTLLWSTLAKKTHQKKPTNHMFDRALEYAVELRATDHLWTSNPINPTAILPRKLCA